MAKALAQRAWGSFTLPRARGDLSKTEAEESPELGVMGRRAARAIGAHQGGWVALPQTGCGQLRFLAVAATWPARCGCHLTPGAQP